MAVRYDYGGKTYFAVRSAIEDDEPPASGAPGLRWCRVNPLQPWQLETIWGWTPSLGMGLFPVPFLAVGVAAWLFGLRWLLQKSRGQSPSLESLGNMGQIAGQLLAMLFIGPIVGVFVSICAEMWSSQSGMSWFLALFLTPFVCVVLMTGWHLCKSLWHVLTGKVGPIPLPKSKFRRGW